MSVPQNKVATARSSETVFPEKVSHVLQKHSGRDTMFCNKFSPGTVYWSLYNASVVVFAASDQLVTIPAVHCFVKEEVCGGSGLFLLCSVPFHCQLLVLVVCR